MAVQGWRGIRSKFVVCAVLAILAALLLGAGKISQDIRERQLNRVAVENDLIVLLSGVVSDIPEEHREQWKRNVESKPSFFMRAASSRLKRMSEDNLRYCRQSNYNQISFVSADR